MPRAAGRFTLPSVTFGGRASNELTIEVEQAVASTEAPADIFMEVEVDAATTYVQAQIVYTLRLFVGVGVGRATLTQPVIAGGEAIVERLGEDSQYQTVRDARSFTVRERRYAIFPQEAGTLTIGPSAFEAMVIPNRGFSRVQRLRSDSLTVEVMPAVGPPASHPDAVWLPARRLELSESWTDTGTSFVLGVPRTRVLTITADGLLETQLPEIEVGQAEGIRQYPDQPELERQIVAAGLEATRTQRYAVLAQAAGEATIPAAEIPWWNVGEERWEIARVEGTVVPVLPGEGTLETSDAPVAPAAAPEVVTRDAGWWPWLAFAFGAGWLLTGLAWWLTAARASPLRRAAPSKRPTLPSQRSLVKQLRAACAVGDAERARTLVLQWGRRRYPASPPASLGALADLLDGDAAAAVGALEGHLYGPRADAWSGGALAAAIAESSREKVAKPAGKAEALEPLYR